MILVQPRFTLGLEWCLKKMILVQPRFTLGSKTKGTTRSRDLIDQEQSCEHEELTLRSSSKKWKEWGGANVATLSYQLLVVLPQENPPPRLSNQSSLTWGSILDLKTMGCFEPHVSWSKRYGEFTLNRFLLCHKFKNCLGLKAYSWFESKIATNCGTHSSQHLWNMIWSCFSIMSVFKYLIYLLRSENNI